MNCWIQKDRDAVLDTVPQGKRLRIVCDYKLLDMDTFTFVPAVVLADVASKSSMYAIPRDYFIENFKEVKDENI